MASSSSSCENGEYDVFLSFRGVDTRNTFVAHLYHVLDQRGFRTFRDDEKLQRGKYISTELLNSINHSKIAVIVFSKNYANSTWCLDELVEIMECRRSKGQIVLPIFYHVKPSQVRKHKRSFFEAFMDVYTMFKWESQEMKRVETRRAAMNEAANISGLEVEANGDEAEFIEQIVAEIFQKLQPQPFSEAEYPVGITGRGDKIIRLLQEDEALFLGICGIGGAGKTTVAKAVFNRVHKQFERSCFLENVKERSSMPGGLAELQSHFLRDILMDKTIKIENPDRGINEIKNRLGNKRLLLVVDDVDNENMLNYLVGVGHDWFGSGSKIIITTRNKRLLEKHGVKIYDIPLLDDNEAIQLFSWHAFKQMKPEDDYVQLSHLAKHYAQGLPLALRVLGSTLGKRSKEEWLALLFRWKNSPPSEIDDVLRISFDCLDKEEKKLFLDIACCFKGYNIECVKNIHKTGELDPVIGIKILCERCLISISKDNTLAMHDLIQKMGQNIVGQESKDPGERSRLWTYEDIYEVFTNNTVTVKIEAIMLPEKGSSLEGIDLLEEGLRISAEAFKIMRKLRILKINGVQLDGCLTHLSNELRYLEWDGYPREYLPRNFHPKKYVQLHLPNSLIKGIGTDSKFLRMLKVLNLRYCKHLVKDPNFSELPSLEELYLTGCETLVEVKLDNMKLKILDLMDCKMLERLPNNIGEMKSLDKLHLRGTAIKDLPPSISLLKRLSSLYLYYCKMLGSLPNNIGEMKSLEKLYLSGSGIKDLPPSISLLKRLRYLRLSTCRMLGSLPSNIGEMKSLEKLYLSGSGIKDLPPSISHLKGLHHLDMTDCRMLGSLPSNIGEMKSLRELYLGGSGIKSLPSSIVQLTNLTSLYWGNCNLGEEAIQNLPRSLKYLILSKNSFASLPESFNHLTNLRTLYLDDCLSLQTLDSLPSSVSHLSAQGCVSLEHFSIPANDWESLNFTGCHKLAENQGNNKPNIYYSQTQLPKNGKIVLPGSEIPSWFSHRYESVQIDEDMTNSVSLRMDDPCSFGCIKEICVCAVFEIEDDDPCFFSLDFEINGSHVGYVLGGNQINRFKTDHIVLIRKTYDQSRGVDVECNSDGSYTVPVSHLARRLRHDDHTPPLKVKVKKWGLHLVMDGTNRVHQNPANKELFSAHTPKR